MIRVEQLSKTYDRRAKNPSPALYDVSFTLPDTGFVCIVGPSGCGKTTLLNAVGGLDRFDGGRISTDDLKDLRCGSRLTEAERNRSFGYIFQSYYLLPQHSAAYNVYLGLHSLDISHKEKLRRVTAALKAVDMERFARREVGQLSGGQQQRVAIARALARRPRVIFADEPTGNLDEANTMNICALLRRISRTSLVVMVTHEERIARFFADRIITLEEGRLKSDSADWERDRLLAAGVQDGPLYTADFAQQRLEGEGVSLRLLREEGAEPVSLTVVVQSSRIVVKLDDPRTAVMGRADQRPVLNEGERPVLRLETVDQEPMDLSWAEEAPQGRAGSGLSLGLLLREARALLHAEKLQRVISTLFLAALTVMTLLTVGDYLMVASIDPEQFIITDSHILELNFERGTDSQAKLGVLQEDIEKFNGLLAASGVDYHFVPAMPSLPASYTTVFQQMKRSTITLSGFSYVPLDTLDPSQLIMGRMPQRPDEIVVDRWVLDAALTQEGVLQNSITDVSYFLNRPFLYSKKNYAPTVVGITDCGEPAIFMDDSALLSLGTMGTEVITLDQFRQQFPGQYDALTLKDDECLVIINSAGDAYADQVGGIFRTSSSVCFTIADAIEADTYASIVVTDAGLDTLRDAMMIANRYFLYCPDKAAMKSLLSQPLSPELDGALRVSVTDSNSDSWAAYRAATAFRMNGRRIVTITVILLSLVMLYLLQRSRVQERIGMIAVYRLLGIPGRKLSAVFALECLLLSIAGMLPAGVVTWLAVAIVTRLPSLNTSLLLPWYAAVITCLALLAFYLLFSLIPLCRLLRQPPARLAARYDL